MEAASKAASSASGGGKGMNVGAANLTCSRRLGGLVQIQPVCCAAAPPRPTAVTAPP